MGKSGERGERVQQRDRETWIPCRFVRSPHAEYLISGLYNQLPVLSTKQSLCCAVGARGAPASSASQDRRRMGGRGWPVAPTAQLPHPVETDNTVFVNHADPLG